MLNFKTTHVLFLFFLLVSISLQSQVSASYYSFGKAVGIASNPTSLFWLEVRMNTQAYDETLQVDRGIPQLHAFMNVIKTKKADLSTGIGIGLPLFKKKDEYYRETFTGFFNLALGLQIRPFPNLEGLHIIGEFQPFFIPQKEKSIETILGLSWGIRYNFGNITERETMKKRDKKDKKRKKRRRR